jgi:hypothetical protein
MEKQRYQVTATKRSTIRVSGGKRVRGPDYVAHCSYVEAESAQDACEIVSTYHIVPGTKWDDIRAEPA